MRFPRWLRYIWWVGLCGLLGRFFLMRLPAIEEGFNYPVDIALLLVFIALILVPIFPDMSLFGLKFKQEIEEMRKEVAEQLNEFNAQIKLTIASNSETVVQLREIKAQIQSTITSNNSVNITMPLPPPDDQLPLLEKRIKGDVSEYLEGVDYNSKNRAGDMFNGVGQNAIYLFRIRYSLEKVLRDIWRYVGLTQESQRAVGIGQIIAALTRRDIISPELGVAIKDIYSVCSPAIHGEPVTKAQVEFVEDVSPRVLEALSVAEGRLMGTN
ncbi:MAG: hypothetical protein KQJ78_07510 [Deltaproteobacteria bacterium]|nr:hypothetical protein [Deltaproteobacteria bacterium]